MKKLNKAQQAIEDAYAVKHLLKFGLIGYDEARNKITPLLKIAEKEAKKIAEKYGKKPPKFYASRFLR